MKELSAYDYDNQQWVTGEIARSLLISQIEQELHILDGANGEDYFNSIKPRGSDETFGEYCQSRFMEHKDLVSGEWRNWAAFK